MKRLLTTLLHSSYYLPVKNYPETSQCTLCFKLRPQAVTGLHRNAGESISCVPSTGSRQVHLRNKAASMPATNVQHKTPSDCKDRRLHGLSPKEKNAFSFYLPRQFSNHSSILHVLPSQSLARLGEHVTSECFRPLFGFSLRWP